MFGVTECYNISNTHILSHGGANFGWLHHEFFMILNTSLFFEGLTKHVQYTHQVESW